MVKKKPIISEGSSSVLVDYAIWKDFYKTITDINKYQFEEPFLYEDSRAPSGKAFEIHRDSFYFSPYDLAKALGLL